MADLILRNVYKWYDKVEVVKDFAMEIESGEFIVLVGPSGCGKSTTLRMIAGLEEITQGELVMGGRVVNEVHPKDRNVAMVFQSYALYPHMSVFENMAFGLRLRRLPENEIQARVKEAADILGLTQYLERKPKALSGGQRQRVAMGRAIVRKPKYFLFDEPLSNLDAKLRAEMRIQIARLHKRQGATSIYVTHDQIEAMTLADRIVVMKSGEIQQIGSPLELYRSPANQFVASFIGNPTMNFLSGQVKSGRLEGSGFSFPLQQILAEPVSEGTALTLGVRPEALRLGEQGLGVFRGIPEVREPLGAEVNIYFKVGEVQMVGRFSPSQEIQEDVETVLSADPAGCHLFETTTERAIRRGA